MSVNFFCEKCQERINSIEFGIGDDINSHAFICSDNKKNWIATVKNPNKKEIIFTAIDNCIINNQPEKRCDAMLHTSYDLLVFIELKKRNDKNYKNWLVHAMEQLNSTIEIFNSNHFDIINKFKQKHAYVCNKITTNVIQQTEKKEIFTHGFRLHTECEINVNELLKI